MTKHSERAGRVQSLELTFGETVRHTSGLAARPLSWREFCAMFEHPVRGREGLADFLALPPAQQSALKDRGIFIGGPCRGGRRRSADLAARVLLTLDADHVPAGLDLVAALRSGPLAKFAWLAHSTRKHSPAAPRFRLLVPLAVPITDHAEHEATARTVAASVAQGSLAWFDSAGFRWSQVCFLPSVCRDAPYVLEANDGAWLDAGAFCEDFYLGAAWRSDSALWPRLPTETAAPRAPGRKPHDPTTAPGLVGAWCRARDVYGVLDEFLSGHYVPGSQPDRWTFTQGASADGAIVYDDGRYLYSHHEHDPCRGQLVNAWDLARIHLFGDRDAGSPAGTPTADLPSQRAMEEFARADGATLAELGAPIVEFTDLETAGGWPAPANFLQDPAAPELDPAAVPGAIGELAAAFAESSGIDPGAVLLPALAGVASALDDRVCIVGDPRTRWYQSARLWTLVIGAPGSGKTPAQREALAPLWAIQRTETEAFETAKAKAAPDDAKPPRPRLIVADTTIEALSTVLIENPRGVLIAADEFESWLGSLDAYRKGGAGSRDRGDWLRLFDGGPHTVERVVRGSVHVPNFGVSISTATTPAAMAKLSKHLPEDGLLQRFLAVLVRRIGEPRESPTRDAQRASERYNELCRVVRAMLPHAHAGGVSLDGAAREALQDFRRRNGVQVESVYRVQPALAGHLAKHPTLLLRLALVLHAARVAEEADSFLCDPTYEPVGLRTIEVATTLLDRLTQHAVAVYSHLGGDAGAYGLARSVARYLLAAAPGHLARRDLIQRVREFRAADERDQGEALRLLEDLGWIRLAQGRYRSAMPTQIIVSPRVQETFAEEAHAERARREARRELLGERTGGSRAAG